MVKLEWKTREGFENTLEIYLDKVPQAIYVKADRFNYDFKHGEYHFFYNDVMVASFPGIIDCIFDADTEETIFDYNYWKENHLKREWKRG